MREPLDGHMLGTAAQRHHIVLDWLCISPPRLKARASGDEKDKKTGVEKELFECCAWSCMTDPQPDTLQQLRLVDL